MPEKIAQLDYKTLSPIHADERIQALHDLWICTVSREMSILARKEVLTGKAKFGIVGDGKELPQTVLAKYFKKGDWRSGYYRDQTLFMALGLCSVRDFFAQLYADSANDPFSGGRQMNAHFSTPFLDDNGEWLDTTNTYNSSADVSSTGGQMARALGLALASKMYRDTPQKNIQKGFSNKGDEIIFCTIGDASTSEGVFWETINAAGVQQVPLVVLVWDDGYGISVPKEYQTTKGSISKVLNGFQPTSDEAGVHILTVKAWDYLALHKTYENATNLARTEHCPVLIHVEEVTQPQGHSTSGSHERYKPEDRLNWESEADGIIRLQQYILAQKIATQTELDDLSKEAAAYAKTEMKAAYAAANKETELLKAVLQPILSKSAVTFPALSDKINELSDKLARLIHPSYYEIYKIARQLNVTLAGKQHDVKDQLKQVLASVQTLADERYHSHLISASAASPLQVEPTEAEYPSEPESVYGFQVLNRNFKIQFERHPKLIAFGEDVGRIGGVNQGFAGLQETFGEDRIFDTGIREWTIIGQAIGLAMRGWRPIAEIQYLDYLVYAMSALSDDLATVRYRSNGTQKAPAIIRTRGHRLEGIWHAGSPMGMLINAMKGIHLCVPRDMTQAAGMYNTLLEGDDPAIVIEVLNGYRHRESLPSNIGDYKVALGKVDILQEGTDLTLLTYGACVRPVIAAVEQLKAHDISVEVIDIQTLMPFDRAEDCVNSLRKTNRLLVVDEDTPGGGSAFITQQVMEVQGGYHHLDSAPQTLTAKEHRTPFGSNGDYFTKPGVEDIFEKVYEIMRESDPNKYPKI